MVSLAPLDFGVGCRPIRGDNGALGNDQRAGIVCGLASGQTLAGNSGDRFLVDHLRGSLRCLLDLDYDLGGRNEHSMVTGLDLLFLEVNNLEESVSFYHDHLGFEIESNSPDAEPPIASVRAGSLRITLVQQLETMLKRGRGVHFVLGVRDVDDFCLRLRTAEVEVNEPRDEGWGGRFVTLQDPDGYRLFFVSWDSQNRER